MPEAADRKTLRTLDIILTALLTVILALGGWMAQTVVQNTITLREIQASRFTTEHGLEVWKEISTIKEAMAKLPIGEPPKWFVEKVETINQSLDRLEDKVDANTQRLIRLEK